MVASKGTCLCFLLSTAFLWVSAPLCAQGRDADFLISGAVVLEDGEPAAEPVEVQLVCAGTVRQRVFTDPRGQFFFRLGDSRSPLTTQTDVAGSAVGNFKSFNQIGTGLGDTGEHGSGRVKFGRANLGDCEIRALLPGFTSDVIYPGVRETLGNPDVGSMTLRRLANVQGITISLKSLEAPEGAANAFRRARGELAKKRVNYARAMKWLERAVQDYAEFASAWHYLGTARLATGDLAGAVEAFQSAARADPEYLLPPLALAELCMSQGDFTKARSWSDEVIRRNSYVIRAHYVSAFASYSLGDSKNAMVSIRKVHEEDSANYPGSHFLLGMLLADDGMIREASQEFREFLAADPDSSQSQFVKGRLAAWQTEGLVELN